jgi:acyl carrier protein
MTEAISAPTTEASIPVSPAPATAATSVAAGRVRRIDDVRATVRAVVMELAPGRDESATRETGLVDGLGYSSLSLLELAFTLEDEFDLEPIEEAVARQITTLGAIEDHVISQLTARGEIVDG